MYNTKTNVIIIGALILIAYTIIALMMDDSSVITLEDVKILGWFAFVQFVYTILSWYKLEKNWINPYIVFSIVLYSFMLSQPILEAMDLAVSHRRLWNDFGISNSTYYWATYYSMIAVLFFHFGAVSIISKLKEPKKVSYQSLRPLKIGASVIAIISAPSFISILVKQFVIVQTIGYVGLYNWEEYTSRLTQIISDAFIPSILVLFCISMITKRNVKLIGLIFILFVFLPPFFLGGRSNAMISFAVFLIVYASVNKIKRKHLIIIGFSGVAMLAAMHIVGRLREDTDRSLAAIEKVSKSNEDNAAISTIEEMGWSMYPTAISIDAIPDKFDYSYGASFFWAGVSVIPNLGFWEGIHPGKLNDPGYKLDQYVDLGYGIGYSIVAGTYNEFGYLGFIIMFIYGIIFSKIFALITPMTLQKNPVGFILAILLLWFSIKFVRNSFDSFVRSIVYYILPFYIMSRMGYKSKVYNNNTSTVQRIPEG